LPLSTLFLLLHLGGLAVYGLSLFYFSAQLGAGNKEEEGLQRVRRFLRWGPVLGLSMGALIAGGLGLFYQQNGAFVWDAATRSGQFELLKHLGFLVLWVSHFHLEIWTQDPLRKLDGPTGPSDKTAWQVACARVRLQLRLNTLAFASLCALSLWT